MMSQTRNYKAERREAYKTIGVTAPTAAEIARAKRQESAPAPARRRGEDIMEATGLPASAPINSHCLKIWEDDPAPATPTKPRPPGARCLRDLTPEQVRVLESRLYWARKVHHKTPSEISHELDLVESDLEALAQTRRCIINHQRA